MAKGTTQKASTPATNQDGVVANQIIKGFDLDAIRKSRARLAASGGVDLVSAIDAISPLIGKLAVGETILLPIPEGSSKRKFVMQITAKLNNLVPKGAPWEGRTYKVLSDGENGVYIQRGEDAKEAVERKRGNGGGRRKAATGSEAVEAGKAHLNGAVQSEGGALVKQH